MDEVGSCPTDMSKGCSMATAVPFSFEVRDKGLDWPPVGHTMVGHARLHNIREIIYEVVARNVPGDFMELGVWRGGLCIFVKAIFQAEQEGNRKVYLLDVFDKMGGYGGAQDYLAVEESAVRHNFDKYGLLDDNVVFIKGLFKYTVPNFTRIHPDAQIAVLRLDSNYYDSHQDCFYYLYEHVPVGGYVVMDDVRAHPPVKAAWEDFKRDQGLPEELTPIDQNGAYFKKTVSIQVDKSKMKPPRDCNKQ